MGIRNWPRFFQKFKPALPLIGNFLFLVDVVLIFVHIVVFIFYLFSRFCQGASRRNKAHVPSFRRRKVATPSVSIPLSVSMPASPHDVDLRLCTRKDVDIEGCVPSAIDLSED